MDRIVEIHSYDDEQNFIRNNKSCVIFFGSDGCSHCRQMKLPYKNLSNKYKNIGFAHVDVNKVNCEDVDAYPVFSIYKNSGPSDSLLGADPESLDSKLQKLLY